MPRVKASGKSSAGGLSRLSPMHRAALLALAGSIVAIGSIILWQSGWPQRQHNSAMQSLLAGTARLGFRLQDVRVEGREHIGQEELREAMQIKPGMPTLALDRAAMAERLRRLPWLAEAQIMRRLPGTLLVKLNERQPLARWQHNDKVQLVDTQGAPISLTDTSGFAHLPLIVGAGAPRQAYDLLADLNLYPAIQQALRAAIYVGERRWDLLIEPGVTVKLPEGKETAGLKRLDKLMQEQQILTRDVQTVDLRFPDRLIIERPVSTPVSKSAKNTLKR